MSPKYILAIDQSTSGTKALLVDSVGRIVHIVSREHVQHYPRPDWVEHDAMEIYENVRRCITDLLKITDVTPLALSAISLTNQRETSVMWDKVTGTPVGNAIVWQCQRTVAMCKELVRAGHERLVREKTGLMIDPYFSATKWAWMLEHNEHARALLREHRLLAGTVDSWVLWNLTGGTVHATDVSNASRTSLYNIKTLEWDEELCNLFNVPLEVLPVVKYSDEVFGLTEDKELFPQKVMIRGVIADSQGALFGQGCVCPGMAKATYGTGTSVLLNIGPKPKAPDDGLVTTIAWGLDKRVTYAAEAIIRSSGDTIRWVRDELGLFETFDQMDEYVKDLADSNGVVLVPAFTGLGAPYWDADARAAIVGISRGTHKSHIIRAALESIAFQVAEALQLMEQTGIELQRLHADGGASTNPLLMQFQADLLGVPVRKSAAPELSAMGSAYISGQCVGLWENASEVMSKLEETLYLPRMDKTTRNEKLELWKLAVERALSRRKQ